MKKWIALLLSCVMLLAMVAGCGGTPAESPSQSGGAGETAPQSAAPDGETKTYKVGFSNVWVGNTWGVQCVNELEAYLRNNEQISEYYMLLPSLSWKTCWPLMMTSTASGLRAVI